MNLKLGKTIIKKMQSLIKMDGKAQNPPEKDVRILKIFIRKKK